MIQREFSLVLVACFLFLMVEMQLMVPQGNGASQSPGIYEAAFGRIQRKSEIPLEYAHVQAGGRSRPNSNRGSPQHGKPDSRPVRPDKEKSHNRTEKRPGDEGPTSDEN
ncbi:uncharacterized protein LOC144646984 isoform X4 [Oculina patagonica]